MTAIATPGKAAVSITGNLPRIIAGLRKRAARAAGRIFSFAEPPCFSLDDRLLRDIGASPLDADLARLRGRWGVSTSADTDALACGSLSVRQFQNALMRERPPGGV